MPVWGVGYSLRKENSENKGAGNVRQENVQVRVNHSCRNKGLFKPEKIKSNALLFKGNVNKTGSRKS